jgi:hypothetical protein
MDIQELLKDKTLKSKDKVLELSKAIVSGKVKIKDVVTLAENSKDPVKATCIEAIEFATKENAGIADVHTLNFVCTTLKEKAPRIKWESAKVIGNIAHLFPAKLDNAIINLLHNTEHSGTVVRWSAAFALSEIIKLKTKHNKELLPAVESIVAREEKNSIRKVYQQALKSILSK